MKKFMVAINLNISELSVFRLNQGMCICLLEYVIIWDDSVLKHYKNITEKKIATLEEVYMLTDVSLEF